MKKTTLTCIVCPKSCDIMITDDNGNLSFEGYGCKRGLEHAQSEYTAPARMLTSTVKVNNGMFNRLGVIGTQEVPKEKLRDCLAEIYKVSVEAPVVAGQVIISDILGTGCDVVAATAIEAK